MSVCSPYLSPTTPHWGPHSSDWKGRKYKRWSSRGTCGRPHAYRTKWWAVFIQKHGNRLFCKKKSRYGNIFLKKTKNKNKLRNQMWPPVKIKNKTNISNQSNINKEIPDFRLLSNLAGIFSKNLVLEPPSRPRWRAANPVFWVLCSPVWHTGRSVMGHLLRPSHCTGSSGTYSRL